MMPTPIHATAVARASAAGWRGALLQGPSGAGKSDLALRLLSGGWRLVADDYAHVWVSGDALYATAPNTIAGRIEVRGLGIVGAASLALARIVLVVDCVQGTVERMPRPSETIVAGLCLPRLELDTRPSSAVESLDLAMSRL